ncbi:hypothetical protein ACHAQH_008070 [Verticillium albo-atrum]
MQLTKHIPSMGSASDEGLVPLKTQLETIQRAYGREFPLVFAVQSAFDVQILIRHGIQIDCTISESGETMNALHFIVWRWCDGRHGVRTAASFDTAQALLKGGIQVDAVWQRPPSRHFVPGFTVLGLCIFSANVQGVHWLLNMGADPNARREMTIGSRGRTYTPIELLMGHATVHVSSASGRVDANKRIAAIARMILAKDKSNIELGKPSASTTDANDMPAWVKTLLSTPHLDSEDMAQLLEETGTPSGLGHLGLCTTTSLLKKELYRRDFMHRNGICRLLSRQYETGGEGADADPFLAKPCLVRRMFAVGAARRGPYRAKLFREEDCYEMQPIDYAVFWLDVESFRLLLESHRRGALEEEIREDRGIARVLRQLLGKPVTLGEARRQWRCRSFGGIEDMDGFVRKYDPLNTHPVDQMPLSLAMDRDWLLRHYVPFGREFDRRVSVMTDMLLGSLAVDDGEGRLTICLDLGRRGDSPLRYAQHSGTRHLFDRMVRKSRREDHHVIVLKTPEDRKLLGGFGCLLKKGDRSTTGNVYDDEPKRA